MYNCAKKEGMFMLLSDLLIWSCDENGISGINVFCDEDCKETVKAFFEETFTEEWNKLLEQVDEEQGNCLELEEEINPFNPPKDIDNGFHVCFDNLAIYCNYGDSIANVSGIDAIETTLEKLKSQYPNVQYEAYIGYRFIETKGGEIVQRNFSSSENNQLPDFVGEYLGANMIDDEFWDNLSDELANCDEEDFIDIFNTFVTYNKWIDEEAFDKLLEIARDIDDDIAEVLEEKIENWKENQ